MTVRVVERKAYDRVGAAGIASPGFTRWAVEQDDGRVLKREWFDDKEAAVAARRKLERSIREDWRL